MAGGVAPTPFIYVALAATLSKKYTVGHPVRYFIQLFHVLVAASYPINKPLRNETRSPKNLNAPDQSQKIVCTNDMKQNPSRKLCTRNGELNSQSFFDNSDCGLCNSNVDLSFKRKSCHQFRQSNKSPSREPVIYQSFQNCGSYVCSPPHTDWPKAKSSKVSIFEVQPEDLSEGQKVSLVAYAHSSKGRVGWGNLYQKSKGYPPPFPESHMLPKHLMTTLILTNP